MTEERQVANVVEMGYSETQARFLVRAALHSGYFLRRQFSPDRGKSADDLCRRLLALKHASVSRYHRRAELYHLGSKPFFTMIGEPDNRHRREHDVIYLRAKLMGLDYVLTHPELIFLPTEKQKTEYFCGTLGLDASLLPGQTYKGKDGTLTRRNFIEKYPMYIHPETKVAGLCYLDDGMYTRTTFAPWLARHKRLIQALSPNVEVVYVATEDSGFEAAAREYNRILTTLPAEFREFQAMRSGLQDGGLEHRSVEWLERYRYLRGRYFDCIGDSYCSPTTTFKTEVLNFSYKALPRIEPSNLAKPGEAFQSPIAT